MTNKIQSQIEVLASLYKEQEKMLEAKKALIASILPKELLEALNEVEVEFSDKIQKIAETVTATEKEVKALVVEAGETVKANGITVAYCNGKTSWDTSLLDKYLQLHPKSPIAKTRKQGKPYASLNK